MLWSTAGSKEGAGHQGRPQWRSHVPHWHQVRGSPADSGGRAAQAEGRGSAKGSNTGQSHRSKRASVAQGSVKGKAQEMRSGSRTVLRSETTEQVEPTGLSARARNRRGRMGSLKVPGFQCG